MSRRSRRELERAINDLAPDDTSDTLQIVWWDEKTQQYVDKQRNPTESDPDAQTIVIKNTLVMEREQAIAEGREILGPAENTPPERDVVKVATENPTFRRGTEP